MPRKAITAADLVPFCQRTGQMHLLDPLNSPKSSISGPVAPVSSEISIPAADLPPKVEKKGKMRGQMNKTEAEFSRILEAQRQRGEIFRWEYEAATLRWGALDAIRYTPDFTIFDRIEGVDSAPDSPLLKMRFIEVKGAHIWSKDMQKFKAARNHWHGVFRFELWQKTKEGWSQLL